MYCTNCGKQNRDGTKFCVFCGKPLVNTASSAQPAAGSSPNQTASQNAVQSTAGKVFDINISL